MTDPVDCAVCDMCIRVCMAQKRGGETDRPCGMSACECCVPCECQQWDGLSRSHSQLFSNCMPSQQSFNICSVSLHDYLPEACNTQKSAERAGLLRETCVHGLRLACAAEHAAIPNGCDRS